MPDNQLGRDGYYRRTFLAGAAAAALSGVAEATASPLASPDSLPPGLAGQIRDWMKIACLPGLSIARLDKGAVTGSLDFGVANSETGQPVTRDSLFEACSMSKPVFAYGVLKLSQAGLIDLDRPLAGYVLPSYYPDDPLIRKITARHVLSHSSGLPPWGDENKPESFKPTFEPGRYFSYSGEGYFWLQLVVEDITGLGLDPFMRKYLFEPAGMRSSVFAGFAEIAPRAVFGHRGGKVAADQGWRNVLGQTEALATKWGKPLRDWTQKDWLRAGAELVPSSPPKRLRFTNAAASLLTTAEDFARFTSLSMDDHRPAAWRLSTQLSRQMYTPVIPVQPGIPLWWGLGWEIERDKKGVLFSHEGNNDNRFTCYSCGNPHSGKGLVILTNDGAGFGVYQKIIRALTGSDPLSFIANVNPPHV